MTPLPCDTQKNICNKIYHTEIIFLLQSLIIKLTFYDTLALHYLYDVYYSNEFSFPKNKPTNNATKIRFDANIKPVLTHWRGGYKVIYILIVYCFYGRETDVGIESG